MTSEEFKNGKWRIGQKVYVIYSDKDKSGKLAFFLREDEVSSICTITTKSRKFVDAITTMSKYGYSTFYSDGCNHSHFIFTNKKVARKGLKKFKEKYENGL